MSRGHVEVDGEIHEQQQEYDAERDDYLRHMGFTVMRVTTERVLCDLNGVICEIQTACAAPPLPRTGEGLGEGDLPLTEGGESTCWRSCG
jgi:very-short-patch-repair endonuclease